MKLHHWQYLQEDWSSCRVSLLASFSCLLVPCHLEVGLVQHHFLKKIAISKVNSVNNFKFILLSLNADENIDLINSSRLDCASEHQSMKDIERNSPKQTNRRLLYNLWMRERIIKLYIYEYCGAKGWPTKNNYYYFL